MTSATDIRATDDSSKQESIAGLSSSALLSRQVWSSSLPHLQIQKSNLAGKRIRLTHLDGKLPNLALMKLSAWFKSKGADVTFSKSVTPELWEQPYDLVLGSAIFAWSENARQIFRAHFPNCVIGGTGTQDATTVEDFIGEPWEEYDYSIYPGFAPSLGFTQRGCRLKCSFCVVPKKEGRIKPMATINEIWRGEGHPKQIILLDNDFFGQPEWRARADELLTGDFEVSLNQGINVRLIHAEGAAVLAKLKYRDDQFKAKRIYTAWDNRKDEEIFLRGIKLLMDAGIRTSNIMVYFLCGYWPGETMDDVMYRFKTMVAMGLKPYPMVYDNRNLELKRFQRWVIRRYYEFVPWEDYGKRPPEKADENQPALDLAG